MGARYLITEDEVIERDYPTAPRAEIMKLIPNRTWAQIGVKARKMGTHRTSKAWGNSVREGRKLHKDAWTDEDNDKFDRYYPHSTREALLNFFYPRTWLALQSHAQKRHIHRTREAVGRQMNIGRENARKKEVKNNMKCKKNYCDGEVIRAEGEFGRCNKCGTVYRFDESGYYFVKNEDDPSQTRDKEIIESRGVGMAAQATQRGYHISTIGDSTCDVCGEPMYDDEGREEIAVNINIWDHPEADRVLKAFGKQSFNVCFVCFLRALGVKE